jgi:hypothetical protein
VKAKAKLTENQYYDFRRGFSLSFSMVSFPKINVNLDVYSLMQGMMKRDTGCLIRLANLVVVEEISKGSFIFKRFYQSACDCLPRKLKCYRYSLQDTVKASDQMSRSKYEFVPKCRLCNQEEVCRENNQIFKPCQLLKVQTKSATKEIFALYVEGVSGECLKAGDILEGVFYLDSVTSFDCRSGRMVGKNTRALITVEMERVIYPEQSTSKSEESLLFQARTVQQYLQPRGACSPEELALQQLQDGVTNICRFLDGLSKRASEMHPYFDLCFVLLLLWHIHDSPNSHQLLFKRLQAHSDSALLPDLLGSKLSSIPMNMIVFDKDSGKLVSRMQELCKGVTQVHILPPLCDEDSIKKWLVLHNNSIIVIANPELLTPKVLEVVSTCLKSHIIRLAENRTVDVTHSFVLLLNAHPSETSSKASPEFQSKPFLDSFDLSLDMNRLRRPTDLAASRNPLFALEASAQLLGSLFTGFQIDKQHSSDCYFEGKNRSKQSAKTSQESRISFLANKICQKFTRNKGQAEKQLFSGDLYVESAKLVLGHVSKLNDEGQVSPLTLISLKKVALALRYLNCFFMEDLNSFGTAISNQKSGKFEISILDAVMAIFLTQASHLFSSGEHYKRNDRASILNLVGAINECLIGDNFANQLNETKKDAGCTVQRAVKEFYDSVVNGISFYV